MYIYTKCLLTVQSKSASRPTVRTSMLPSILHFPPRPPAGGWAGRWTDDGRALARYLAWPAPVVRQSRPTAGGCSVGATELRTRGRRTLFGGAAAVGRRGLLSRSLPALCDCAPGWWIDVCGVMGGGWFNRRSMRAMDAPHRCSVCVHTRTHTHTTWAVHRPKRFRDL